MKISKLLILLAPLCLVNCGGGGNNTPDPASAQTPLCITCTSDDSGLLRVCQFTTELEVSNLQYSSDNKNWQDVDFFPLEWDKILHKGETLYFRGNNPNGFSHITFVSDDEIVGHCISFVAADGTFDVGGNIMSLIQPEGFDNLTDIPNDYCFANLFSLNDYIAPEVPSFFVDASNLSLPAVNLKTGCYYQMFQKNLFLANSPNLPATSLVENCYTGMFEYCDSLKRVQVGFNEEAFVSPYPYTQNWLYDLPLGDGDKPVFVWPGDKDKIDERNGSTIPENWEVQKI